MAKITLTLDVQTVSAAAVRNAVRRSLSNAEFDGDKGQVGDVKYSVKHVTPKGAATEVRAWAVEQGLPVGTRGRIAPDLYDAYTAAHAE